MIKKNPKYKVRAWYYKPIIDNSGATSKTYEANPIMFYCAYKQKSTNGLELLPNTIAESKGKIIETGSLIEFSVQGKVCFDYINPSIDNADKILRDGITVSYGDKSMSRSNRFKSNQFKKTTIKLG